MPRRITSRVDHFWSKVAKGGERGCWEWTAGLSGTGYGYFWTGSQQVRAHRYSWVLSNGEIPAGFELDHICHNIVCVNPAHLRLTTRKQNKENAKGAYSNSRTGVRGVYLHEKSGRYLGRVRHNGRTIHVGYFDSIEDAEAAVIAKRNELFTHNNADRTAHRLAA